MRGEGAAAAFSEGRVGPIAVPSVAPTPTLAPVHRIAGHV